MERIGAHTVTHDFRHDSGSAAAGEFQFLQHQDAGAFSYNEPIAILVPRPGSPLRFVVAGGKRAHGGKAAHSHRSDAGFGTAADHGIGIVVLDEAEGIADGMGAGGASGGGSRVRSL